MGYVSLHLDRGQVQRQVHFPTLRRKDQSSNQGYAADWIKRE